MRLGPAPHIVTLGHLGGVVDVQGPRAKVCCLQESLNKWVSRLPRSDSVGVGAGKEGSAAGASQGPQNIMSPPPHPQFSIPVGPGQRFELQCWPGDLGFEKSPPGGLQFPHLENGHSKGTSFQTWPSSSVTGCLCVVNPYHVLGASPLAYLVEFGACTRVKGGVLNQGPLKGKLVQTTGVEPKGVGTAMLDRAGLLAVWPGPAPQALKLTLLTCKWLTKPYKESS